MKKQNGKKKEDKEKKKAKVFELCLGIIDHRKWMTKKSPKMSKSESETRMFVSGGKATNKVESCRLFSFFFFAIFLMNSNLRSRNLKHEYQARCLTIQVSSNKNFRTKQNKKNSLP